jgi:hypothetical protein
MAIDLFSLRMNMEVGGAAQAKSALQEIDAIGRRTAQAMQGVGNDARLATSAFLTGRASLTDFRTALGVAGEQATALQGRFRGLATVTAGVFRGIGDAIAVPFQRATSAISGFLSSTLGKIVAFTAVVGAYRSVTEAADNFTRSTLRLEGAARFANIPLELSAKWAGQIKSEFRTSTPVANDIAGVFMRLGARAGDMNAAAKSMRDFLNVGASMGLSASETIFRVEQAMRGLDEGTDVLFQKNPIQIYKEYAASIGTVAGRLTSAQMAQALMNEAMIASARDPGAYQRFLDTLLGKQGVFNARLLDAKVAFGTALGPLRLFAYELGTTLINSMSAAWVGLTQGWGTLKSLFGDALPGIVQLGAGKVLLILADFAGAVTGLFAKLGINLGTGIVAGLGVAGARLVQAGHGNLAAFNAQRESVNQQMADAAAGGTGADMSPITFPDMPGGSSAGGSAGGPSESAQAKRLRQLERMGGAGVDAPNKLGFSGLGGGIKQRGRIGIGDFAAGKGVAAGSGETAFDQFEARVKQASERTQGHFAQLGANLGMTLADGFSAALGAALQGKNPFKAFGNVVLSGLGGIMQQMGQAMIQQGVILLNLLPFLSNPFSSGPALIAAGVALSALGSMLGGIASGSGKGGGAGGSGGFQDRTTRITLTADGMGGRNAPTTMANQMPTLLVDSPRGQRVLATSVRGAARRNIK